MLICKPAPRALLCPFVLVALSFGLVPKALGARPPTRPLPPAASATQQVSADTRALVEAFRSCCQDAGTPTAACRAADSFFAFPQSAADAVAPLSGRLNSQQRKRLIRALEDIFRFSAQQSGGAFCGNAPTFGAVQPQKNNVVAEVFVVEAGEDVATKIAFVWRLFGKAYRVVDLLLEGGSLVADYQNQFTRIVGKDGAEALVRRVESRRANVPRTQRTAPSQSFP